MKFCTYQQENEKNPINNVDRFEKVTDKYKLIRTDKVIEVFKDNGLNVIGESIANTRKPEKIGFQKHLVAFSNDQLNHGSEQLQLLLTNSHDGSSSYQLDLGAFRFACANGLVHGDVESTIKIRHVGNCLDRLDEAIRYQLDRLPNIAAKIEQLKQFDLTPEQIYDFTLKASKIRCNNDNINRILVVKTKRFEDHSDNVWTVFNKIQEACLRGGLSYFDPEAECKRTKTIGKWKKTRKLTGVSAVTKINKELWSLAESYCKVA